MTVLQFATQTPRSQPCFRVRPVTPGATGVVIPLPVRQRAVTPVPEPAAVAPPPRPRGRRTLYWIGVNLVLLMALLIHAGSAHAERIKDLADVAGVRDNPLVGYGLVVGLNGTGDQTSQAPFTVQSLESMLSQLGVTVPAGTNPQLKNVAAVAIHATLPAFAKPGQKIDITVSSIGNAGSLRGGALLMTPLKGADGQIYAIAQGNVVVGGLGVSGGDGSKVTINIPSAGLIPNGATVERAVAETFGSTTEVTLNLHDADFTTASRMVQGIDAALGQGSARALDAVSIAVKAPADLGQRVGFIAQLENLDISPGEAPARVVINARTGTVVIGGQVRVSPAAVSSGALSVTITERPQVSQPEPFSQGQTVVTPKSSISVEQQDARMFVFAPGTTLDELVRAVNQVGAAPGDIVSILEALKQAGALHAQLVVI